MPPLHGIANYVAICVCMCVGPYASTIHNVIDGIILQLIVIISVLPMVELVDDYHETSVLVRNFIKKLFY